MSGRRKRKLLPAAAERSGHSETLGGGHSETLGGGHWDKLGGGQDEARSRSSSPSEPRLRLRLRLGEEFFRKPCVRLARALLGKVLVRRCEDGTELRGRIVETEAYLGGEDKASHSAGGKRTERNTAMFMKPGTIYVYPIYGVYLCMNVSSEGEGAAVLLRSLEPLQGHEVMRRLRAKRRGPGASLLKDKDLCNGPSKLCQALQVPRLFDRRDLAADPEVWLEDDEEEAAAAPGDVVAAPRIGIEAHGEWALTPLRFYLRGHPCVSKRNREVESRLEPAEGTTDTHTHTPEKQTT